MHRDPLARARTARRALTLAALAAALVAAPAGAQTRRDAAARTAARPASTSSAPALGATAPAASQVPLPPAPAGASATGRRVGWLALSAGPWAGFDSGAGAALQVDYGFLRTPPGWSRLRLEVHLAATLARTSDSTDLTSTIVPPYGPPVSISAGVEKMNAWVVQVVPSARAILPVGPKFSLLGDAGLGLVQTIESYERDEMFAGHTDTTRNVTSLVLQVGAGMSFDLSERTRLLFLPLALSLQLSTGFSAYVPTVGLAYRL